MKQITLLFLLSLMILGCSETAVLNIPKDEAFKLVIVKEYHRPISCVIRPGTDQFTRLLKLLDENNANWKSEYASVLPRVTVTNPKLTVSFSGDLIVTSVGKNQYSHKIQASDYAFLSCD